MTGLFMGSEEDIKQSQKAAAKMKWEDYNCYLFLAEHFHHLQTNEAIESAREILDRRRKYCDDMQALIAGREPPSGEDYGDYSTQGEAA